MTTNITLPQFTVVDVETPNASQNSICSIAILHVEDNQITFAKECLVNPQARFDDMNMSIHHITRKMVENAPTFPSVWNEIKHFFTNGVLIAHNATFDLRVIAKTLASYDIAVPDFQYICTLKKARRHISKEVYGCHKLNVLCDAYHIDLDHHHDAMCDTKACKSLFELFALEYGIQDSDIETFSLNVGNATQSARRSILQKAMNSIYGVIFGIGCDNLIRVDENKAIYNWMNEYVEYESDPEFNKCYSLLHQVLEDNFITNEEYYMLMKCVCSYIKSNTYSDNTLSMQILKGIIEGIAVDNEVNSEEANKLYQWMAVNVALKGNYPFDKIFITLESFLENGVIDQEEEKELLAIFNQFSNPQQEQNLQQVQNPKLDLTSKVCCLTGTFTSGTKSDIESFIICKGGTCIAGLNQKVDYLVVGGQGSSEWKYGNYGAKVSKALEMQEKGIIIQIISEEVLYKG